MQWINDPSLDGVTYPGVVNNHRVTRNVSHSGARVSVLYAFWSSSRFEAAINQVGRNSFVYFNVSI